jgi:hypothetical protein
MVQGLRGVDSREEWNRLKAQLEQWSPKSLEAAGFPVSGGQLWLPWSGSVPALLIPYFSREGVQVEAIRFRALGRSERRYMAPCGAGGRIPWRAEAFDGPRPLELVVTEGELDALTLLQSGYESVALGGATPSSATIEWIVDAVENVGRLALWTDSDRAGDGAVDRLARALADRYGWPWVARHVVRWRSRQDANDLAMSGDL